MPKGKLTGERIANVILLLISGFYLYYTLTHYKIGTVKLPKEGFMPMLLGVGMVGITAFLTVQAFLGKGDSAHVKIKIQWWRFGAIVAVSILYAITMGWLGYTLSTCLFLYGILKLARVKGWVLPLLVSVGTAVGFYLVFKVALGVMLPPGFLGF